MKTNIKLLVGLLVTAIIFYFSNILGSRINIKSDFIPSSFVIHTLILLLSLLSIGVLRKEVQYRISLPKLSRIFRPVLFGFLGFFLVNFLFGIITMTASGDAAESHPALQRMDTLQVFVFVFIYASIAEELLFRGLLMNLLKPLKNKGIRVFKIKISLPVIIAAVLFGLGHLVLIQTGAGTLFLVRVVTATTVLGLVAGYYQEKYNNNAYAIIAHMGGNLLAVIPAIISSFFT